MCLLGRHPGHDLGGPISGGSRGARRRETEISRSHFPPHLYTTEGEGSAPRPVRPPRRPAAGRFHAWVWDEPSAIEQPSNHEARIGSFDKGTVGPSKQTPLLSGRHSGSKQNLTQKLGVRVLGTLWAGTHHGCLPKIQECGRA